MTAKGRDDVNSPLPRSRLALFESARRFPIRATYGRIGTVPAHSIHNSWSRLTAATLFAAALLLAGCFEPVGLWVSPPSRGPVDLKAGVGWSSSADPADAVREAFDAAVRPLGRAELDAVFVWDNWSGPADARAGLAALARRTSVRSIYGGHCAWPITLKPSTDPAVTVLALAGGWGVRAAGAPNVGGTEADVAASLIDALGAGPNAPANSPAASQADQPDRAGDLVIVFGDLAGRRAEGLAGALGRRIDRRIVVFGGGGSGVAGSGWQYAAGRLRTDTVWAVRLTGPFDVSAVQLPADADAAAVAETVQFGLTILRHRPAPSVDRPWQLVMMSPSAGWLGCTSQPEQLAALPVERFGPGTLVAGWAGDSQIGPDTQSGAPSAGRFGVSMALLVPRTRAARAPLAGSASRPDGR